MTKANELAFPIIDITSGAVAAGLTKREYFAAKAMQGLLSDARHVETIHTLTRDSEATIESIASTANQYADALIRELEK